MIVAQTFLSAVSQVFNLRRFRKRQVATSRHTIHHSPLTIHPARYCLGFVCLLLLSLAPVSHAQSNGWVFPSTHWDTSRTPESLGMDRSKLDTFKTSLGAASTGCIIKNGYLVYSWGNIAANYDWASAAKPCLSTMLFAAINEGRVTNPDSSIFPWWPALRPSDQTMSFRHLADMMSGYACNDRDSGGNLLPPGSRWAYNDYAIMLYVKTLDKVFGTTDKLVTAGNQRFVVPLQFEDGVLFDSALGRVKASPRDFARMGWFWLNTGNWNGAQVLPKHFFDDYLKPDVPFNTVRTTNNTPDDYLGVGSYGGGINQHDGPGIYGFNWWHNRCLTVPPRDPPLLAWPSAPADAFLASGHFGKECVAVIPSLGIVAAAYNASVASWGDTVITDPPNTNATLNQNFKLLAESAVAQPVTPVNTTVLTNYAIADVAYNNTDVYNAYSQSQQINWGLGASGGVVSGSRRAFIMFTLGMNPVTKARFKLWNYWGGPPVNGQGRVPEANTRIYGTLTNRAIMISEPPTGSHATIAGYIAPDDTNFFAIAPDQVVGPAIGWYEWDITAWYNLCLGQTTTIMVRASATSGFDFPLYEDREATAFTHAAGGTSLNTGPRIEYELPAPRITSISISGGQLLMSGYYGPPGGKFTLLSSTDVSLPVSNWTHVVTNQFDTNGYFTVTNPLVGAASYFRLRIP